MRRVFILLPLLILAACAPVLDVHDASFQRLGARLLHGGQPFSGVVSEQSVDGIRTQRSYADGLLQGAEMSWYPDGKLRTRRSYDQGERIGIHRGWWPDGTRQFEYHFAHDEFEGTALQWFRNGQIASEQHYHRGHESGLQQAWFDDGALKAIYDARNGRHYGMVGTQPCFDRKKPDARDVKTGAAT